MKTWKVKAEILRQEVYALYLCSQHPRTPLFTKLFCVLIIGYALSPIDLIPDFVPLLGYLDDLLLIPAGIALLIKMIPEDVLQECRDKARENPSGRKIRSRAGAIVIVCTWIAAAYAAYCFVSHLTGN